MYFCISNSPCKSIIYQCGFVVKLHNGKAFYEYSLDDISGDKEILAERIAQAVAADPSLETRIYEAEEDFEGDYLGEVELKLEQTSLNDCETIHFENEEDLFKKIVLFIQKSTENYIAVAKDDPLDIVVAKASDSLYEKYCRGEVTSLICNSAFKTNHTCFGWQDVDTIEAEFLPDNLAIGIYQNDKMD